MEIIVKRGEEEFGPFSPEQLKEQLQKGSIMSDDWAWHDGLSDWVPAQSLVENVPALVSVTEPVSEEPVKASSSTAPAKSGIDKKILIVAAVVLVLGGSLAAAFVLGVFGGDEAVVDVAVVPEAQSKPIDANQREGAGSGNAQGSGSGGSNNTLPSVTPPVTPPVGVGSSTSFNAVTQKLDAGGSFYFYLSTAQAQQWVQTVFTEGGNLVKQMGSESPPSEGDPAEALIGGMGAMIAQFAGTGIEVGQAAYTGLGLDSIDGVGASTRDLGGGLKRNVAAVHHDPAKMHGLIWKAFGTAPHELGALKLMPAETVYAMHGDLNLTAILQWVQAMVADHGTPEMLDELNTYLKSPPVLAVNGGYSGEMGVYVTFDPVKMIKVPTGNSPMGGVGGGSDTTTESAATEVGRLPQDLSDSQPIRIPTSGSARVEIPALPSGAGEMQMIEIPEPGIVITMKVKDNSIQKMLEGLISTQIPLQPVDLGGVTMNQLPQPMTLPDLPVAIQPAMFQVGDYLVIASTPALANKVITVHNEQSQGLKGTAEFQKMSKEMPLTGNHIIYVSGRVKALSENIFKQSLLPEMGDGLPKPVGEMITKFMTMGSSAGLSVIQVHNDGMVMHTHTEGMGYDTMALAGTAAIPVALAGATWLAGSFAEGLLGGSSDPFDGGFDREEMEGEGSLTFPSEGESNPAGEAEGGPVEGAVPTPSIPIAPKRLEKKQ